MITTPRSAPLFRKEGIKTKIPALYKGRVGRGIIILLFLFSFHSASASLILQHPNYTGLNQGLVGYWSFDGKDMSGTVAYDRSDQGNNGTLTNGPVKTIGKLGQALNFDGSNDNVDAGSASSLDNIFVNGGTISTWIYVNSLPDGGASGLVSKNNGNSGFSLGLCNERPSVLCDSGQVNVVYFTANFTGGNARWTTPANSITLKKWQHIVITYNHSSAANNPIIYIDGISQAVSGGASGSFLGDETSNLVIASGYSLYYDGKIDDIRLYNRALTANEIKRLYRLGDGEHANDILQKGLVGYWSMNEGSGSVAHDRSGKGLDGALTNGATWSAGKYGDAININANATLGTGPYITIPSLPSLPKFTVSFWWNAEGGGSTGWGGPINDRQGGSNYGFQLVNNISNTVNYQPELVVLSNGDNETYWTPTDTSLVYARPFGKFKHFVWTFDGTKATFTVDGENIPVQNSGSNYWIGSGIQIGAAGTGSNGVVSVKGLIDEVRIYNRVLAPSEIQRLYKAGSVIIHANVSINNDTLKNGLVGWWSFDGKDMIGGTVYDRSGQGNNGHQTNMSTSTAIVAGKLGQALKFDGVDDYVGLGTGAVTTNGGNLTVCSWVKPNSTGDSYIIRKGIEAVNSNELSLGYTNTSGSIYAFYREISNLGGRQHRGNTALSLSTWYHVCATRVWGATTPSIYVNANQESLTLGDNSTPTYGQNATAQQLRIGQASDGTLPINGSIDDVRIYNRALTPDEIKRLYNLGR